MRPTAEDGSLLDAEFRVEDVDGETTVLLEARGGSSRNPDYQPALELLLRRLKAIDAVLTRAAVDSTVSRRLPFEERVLRISGMPFPIQLDADINVRGLAVAIGAAQKTIAQVPGTKGGNRSKRLRMYLSGVEPNELEQRLAHGCEDADDFQAEVTYRTEDSEFSSRDGEGQGRGLSAPQRRAVELRAMEVVAQRFRRDGWTVSDVSAERIGYDLRAVRADAELHIEVKGTTRAGSKVTLTANEVRHARQHPTEAVLSVVSGIRLIGSGDSWEAHGGTERSLAPWLVSEGRLTPLTYEWEVPG